MTKDTVCEPGWAPSADKHGIDRADALHAIRSAALLVRHFDESRIEGRPPPDLFIGPNRTRTELIEVMAIVDHSRRRMLIFHVMPLRSTTLRRARTRLEER